MAVSAALDKAQNYCAAGGVELGRILHNNIVEQDHRAIKSRCASMLGFKSSELRPLRSQASNWRIVFARDSSPSPMEEIAA